MPTSRLVPAAALLALAACADSGDTAIIPVPVEPLDPIAAGYATPDPSYVAPGNAGDINCATVVQYPSTGPINVGTQFGLSEWRDYAGQHDAVAPPAGDADAQTLASYIVEFCRGTPVADVDDAVKVFLSSRPGAVGQSFGGVVPPGTITSPELTPGPIEAGLANEGAENSGIVE